MPHALQPFHPNRGDPGTEEGWRVVGAAGTGALEFQKQAPFKRYGDAYEMWEKGAKTMGGRWNVNM